MEWDGFSVDIELDERTGLLFGGNLSNAGTWMDCVGQSSAAGNLGKVPVPRDGCPVEIAALVYKAVSWLESLREGLLFPYRGVFLRQKEKVRMHRVIISFSLFVTRMDSLFVPVSPVS